MSNDALGRIPVIHDSCRLYFDGQHDRWVLKAPQRAVFLDTLSLLILQACDGCCSARQIAGSIAACERHARVSEGEVVALLLDFERRGFLCSRAG